MVMVAEQTQMAVPGSMVWFACSACIPDDAQIGELADRFGAKGPWTWICLLAEAKNGQGEVAISGRSLRTRACLDSHDELARILRVMSDLGIVRELRVSGGLVYLQIAQWERWQKNPGKKVRVRREKEPKDRPPLGGDIGHRTKENVRSKATVQGEENVHPLTNAVIAHMREAAETNRALRVNRRYIANALADFANLPQLERHCRDCATWLADPPTKRVNAAATLRSWLRRVEEHQTRRPRSTGDRLRERAARAKASG